MAEITYIESSGEKHKVDVDNGLSVMHGAISNGIPGIDAECGGSCVCSTCHVYISEDWVDSLEEADEMESIILEEADKISKTSRLSCQIIVNEKLDGLVIHLPESQ